jgi:hypothetical protein
MKKQPNHHPACSPPPLQARLPLPGICSRTHLKTKPEHPTQRHKVLASVARLGGAGWLVVLVLTLLPLTMVMRDTHAAVSVLSALLIHTNIILYVHHISYFIFACFYVFAPPYNA